MTLDPTLSLVVLALLGLIVVFTVMRSIFTVTKRVIQVGLIAAVLLGAGVLQVPADTPVIGGMADGLQSSLTGMIAGTAELSNSTNTTAVQENATASLLDQLSDLLTDS